MALSLRWRRSCFCISSDASGEINNVRLNGSYFHRKRCSGRIYSAGPPGNLMNTYLSTSKSLLALIASGLLLHTHLASAASCDLPMCGGARLFPSVVGSKMLAMGDFNHYGFMDLAT